MIRTTSLGGSTGKGWSERFRNIGGEISMLNLGVECNVVFTNQHRIWWERTILGVKKQPISSDRSTKKKVSFNEEEQNI